MRDIDILLKTFLVWDKSLGRAWRSLTFYPLRLMYQIRQRDSSTLWYFTVELFAKWSTKQVRGTLLPSDTLRLSYLLSGVANRSGGLFYPLTLLRFNSKRSIEQVGKDYYTFQHFYGLARYVKHQTGQEGLFYPLTFLRFSCSLCKIPNRSRGTLLPSDTLRLGFLHSALSWIITIEMDWLHHRLRSGFDLDAS